MMVIKVFNVNVYEEIAIMVIIGPISDYEHVYSKTSKLGFYRVIHFCNICSITCHWIFVRTH